MRGQLAGCRPETIRKSTGVTITFRIAKQHVWTAQPAHNCYFAYSSCNSGILLDGFGACSLQASSRIQSRTPSDWYIEVDAASLRAELKSRGWPQTTCPSAQLAHSYDLNTQIREMITTQRKCGQQALPSTRFSEEKCIIYLGVTANPRTKSDDFAELS